MTVERLKQQTDKTEAVITDTYGTVWSVCMLGDNRVVNINLYELLDDAVKGKRRSKGVKIYRRKNVETI